MSDAYSTTSTPPQDPTSQSQVQAQQYASIISALGGGQSGAPTSPSAPGLAGASQLIAALMDGQAPQQTQTTAQQATSGDSNALINSILNAPGAS
jgi:hypothetical protein